MNKRSLSSMAILVLAAVGVFPIGVMEIVKTMDDKQAQVTDMQTQVTMVQNKATEKEPIRMQMLMWRRDKDDKFLMLIVAPESDKGNGYLKDATNMWMYRKNTGTFQIINRDDSINGSDAKAGDFEKRKLTELYKPLLVNGKEDLKEVKLAGKTVYQFTLVARVNDVTYPKQIYWVDPLTLLPRKNQSFSGNGDLMQTAYFIQFMEIEGRMIMKQALFVDEFIKGNKTMIELGKVSLAKIPDSIFTKAKLKEISK